MDKFYVKPKKYQPGINTRSSTSKSTTSSTCRTSAEIFQTASNSKRLGVGNIYSKIRHKIEDNLTPKISGRLYKTAKHSKSLTALSSIGATTGKYTLSNINFEEPKPRSSHKSNEEAFNPYAECYNTSKEPASFAKSSLESYGDSDEEDTQMSLNMAKTSLEDEIFKELEKVSHDENKLISVLESFDKIIFDYNETQIQENQSMAEKEQKAQNPSDLGNENIEKNENEIKTLKKSSSTLSLSPRKCYQSPDSPGLRQMRNAFAQHYKSKSVWELSNATKIPILKTIPLRTRSKSFCHTNSEESFASSSKLPRTVSHRPIKAVTKPLISTVTPEKSLTPLNGPKKIEASNNSAGKRDEVNKENKPGVLIIKTSAARCSPSKSPTKTISSSKTLQLNNFPSGNRKLYIGNNTNLTSLSLPCHNKTSDQLLDKCLEKGQQILRKVESLNPKVPSTSRKTVTRTKSNSNSKITRTNVASKRKQWLQKLNYADEEKLMALPLESCKIIPPVLGETSDKHAELLVQVANAALLTSNKQPRIISTASQLAQAVKHSDGLPMKAHESDSDDSGHISNENMEISINHTPYSSSSNSLCENVSSQSPVSCSALKKTCNNGVVTQSLKMAEVLKKFEEKSFTTNNHSKMTKLQANTNESNTDGKSSNSGNSRFCTTCRVAEVEAVSVIRTHVEFYPNYSKEVTIRLR